MSRTGPFPGMDPWLEKSWGDVHQSMITYARDSLNGHLPEPLAARVEERVFVETPEEPHRKFVPDVRVVEYPTRAGGAATAVAEPGVAAAEPYLLPFTQVEVTESYIEIRDFSSGGRVITLIELVSQSNKLAGQGREKYIQKQSEAMTAKVNIVEIDLLRGGRGVTLAAQCHRPAPTPSPYHASIHRQTRPTAVEFFPIQLRAPLPKLRIPLRPEDKDVVLDLQKLLTQAYVAARYAMTIDYDQPPEPPLSPDDHAWTRQFVDAWRGSASSGPPYRAVGGAV